MGNAQAQTWVGGEYEKRSIPEMTSASVGWENDNQTARDGTSRSGRQ